MGVRQLVQSLHKIECNGVGGASGIVIIWSNFYVQTKHCKLGYLLLLVIWTEYFIRRCDENKLLESKV